MKKLTIMLLAAALALNIGIPAYVSASNTAFDDVEADAWYADAVTYCRENGLMGGTTDTTFEPDRPMTRSMMVSVLYQAADSPQISAENPFSDVVSGSWYADAVLWALGNDIVSGYDNGLFGTEDPVTREQIAVILWRYENSQETKQRAAFTDRGEVSDFAAAAVDWVSANGIMNGDEDNRFDPGSDAARAEVAAILMNYMEQKRSSDVSAADEPNVLIAYFSLKGNVNHDSGVDAVTSASVVEQNGVQVGTTELIARMIQNQVGGDIHSIETTEAYPSVYADVVDQNHKEIEDGVRPALSGDVDLTGYDVIFIGYPVWASNTPAPVLSFLEGHDLTGKTVIPFCTHDGYGAGSSYAAVSRAGAGAVLEGGLAIEATKAVSAQREVETWLNGLNVSEIGERGDNSLQVQGGTPIAVMVGGVSLDGVLYDNPMAREFMDRLPETVAMVGYGGREYYGGAGEEISPAGEGQLRFENGDITYCPANNSLAIFYAQTDRPNLTMEVYPIGRVTSDLEVFDTLDRNITITFERADRKGE